MILQPDDRLDLPSASGFEALALCPGSLNAQIGKPELKKSEDDVSMVGNRVHEALQFQLGTKYLNGQREAWLYDACVRGEEAMLALAFPEGTEYIRDTEIRLGIANEHGQVMATGRFDVRYRAEDVTVILDYKTGPLSVTRAADNPQVAGLIVAEYQDRPVSRILGGIIQPMAKEPSTLVQYTPETIKEAEAWATEIVMAAMEPGAPRVAGEKQCRYCRAKGQCPEAIAAALDAEPKPNKIEKIGRKEHIVLPPLTGSELALLKPRLDYAAKVIKAVNDEIKLRLEVDPLSVPGYILKPWSKSVVTDVDHAVELSELSYSDYLKQIVGVGKGDLRKAFNIKKGHPLSSTKDEKEFLEIYSGILSKVPDTPHLVAGDYETLLLEEGE